MSFTIEKSLISKDATVRQAMERLNSARKVLFVVEEKRLIGSLTDGDVRRWILAGGGLDELVSSAMFAEPRFVFQDSGGEKAARKIINEKGMLAIPILNGKHEIVDIVFWNENLDQLQFEKIDNPVVVMAGGKGERLMPYTSIVPKPLIPVGEKPISELVIDSFRKYGCNEFYFTLNYKKNMIKAYYDELPREYTVNYVEEDVPLGTGGSLFLMKEKIDRTFFVSNCDILLDVDYADVLKFHKKHQNIITVVTSLKKYSIPYGIVKISEMGKIEALLEKPSMDYLVNTGVYVIEPKLLDMLVKKKMIHMTEIIEMCLEEGLNVGAYPIGESAWMDMGQFEDMERMKAKLES